MACALAALLVLAALVTGGCPGGADSYIAFRNATGRPGTASVETPFSARFCWLCGTCLISGAGEHQRCATQPRETLQNARFRLLVRHIFDGLSVRASKMFHTSSEKPRPGALPRGREPHNRGENDTALRNHGICVNRSTQMPICVRREAPEVRKALQPRHLCTQMAREASTEALLGTRRYTDAQLCAPNYTDVASRKQDRATATKPAPSGKPCKACSPARWHRSTRWRPRPSRG